MTSSRFCLILRNCRPTRRATGKAPSMTTAMLPRVTRCWRQQVKRAWLYRRGRLLGSLTWVLPSFCCLRLPETSPSTCSPDSESEWEKASVACDWLQTWWCGVRERLGTGEEFKAFWVIFSVEDIIRTCWSFMTWTQAPRMLCASWRRKRQTSLSLFMFCLSVARLQAKTFNSQKPSH